MLQASFFKNKRITVFGLGLNMGGVGTVKFLAEQGAREIIVTDIKSRSELGPALEKLAKYKQVKYVLGQHRPEDFTHSDMVIKNPVIPWTNEYIKLAEKNGVPVEMDSGIFFALCKNPIIGVTGTKGKTTTATLIAHVLEKTKKRVVKVGIGQVGVLGTLANLTPESVVVFELSSWRLSALGRLKKSPHVAVFTNIYPDHLNYYKTLETYVADKKNIFLFQRHQDFLIANFDNVLVRNLTQDAMRSTVIYFTQSNEVDGDGAWIQQRAIHIRKQGQEQFLIALADIPLRGEHNVGNILATVNALLAYGLTPAQIVNGIKSFPGVPHRLEHIRDKQGVQYYNDTAATIPEATIASISAFTEPLILIAGGSDKSLVFDALASLVCQRVKTLILFSGTATEKFLYALKKEMSNNKIMLVYHMVENMTDAIALASHEAQTGDVVLLSPGAASFGIFKNEFDRGEQFRQEVLALT
ncbi:MAG: UDP-N-acetylmuramoyl-L-alanine--D-glutamate ligase [Minisyncoccota bacterium]